MQQEEKTADPVASTGTPAWASRTFGSAAPYISARDLAVDIPVAMLIALLALPQAVALAALVGVPPQYGIYAAVFPVVVAAVVGRFRLLVSGPETAIAMLIGATLAGLALPGSPEYVKLVLLLTLMTGVIQLVVALGRFGRLLDLISSTVIEGLTAAVAVSILVAAVPAGFGVELDSRGLLSLLNSVPELFAGVRAGSAVVFVITLVTGLVLLRIWPRFTLLGAFLAGNLAAFLVSTSASGTWGADIRYLDPLELELLPFSNPFASGAVEPIIGTLVTGAVSIALLGLVQTTVLARSLGSRSEERVDTEREILAQGVSNTVAGFFSGFAGSASFSRSTALHQLGARTRLAPFLAGILMMLIALSGQAMMTLIAVPVISGVLALTSVGIFSMLDVKRIAAQPQEMMIFWMTLVSALFIGLNEGVLIGVGLSILIYFWITSWPRVRVEELTTSDGLPMHRVEVIGNLFFGSIPGVEKVLRRWTSRDGKPSTLVVSLDHVTYLDLPAGRMLLEEGRRRRRAGAGFFLVVDRDNLVEPLRRAGLLEQFGEDVLVNPYTPHPLKEKLFPFRHGIEEGTEAPDAAYWSGVADGTPVLANPEAFKALQERLRGSRLFSLLGKPQLERLLADCTVTVAAPWEPVGLAEGAQNGIVVLLGGGLDVVGQRESDSRQQVHRTIRSGDRQGIVLASALRAWNAKVYARTECRYTVIEQEKLDGALAGVSLQGNLAYSQVSDNYLALSFLDVLRPEVRQQVLDHFQTVEFKAGEFVIHQGDPGDSFYLLTDGDADVLRRNPFDSSVRHVATLGPGDSFGEEALLSGLTRNADVRMVTDGELQRLDKDDFDKVVRPVMVPDISLDNALKRTRERNVHWLDCRFPPEYEAGHLADALLIPLDELRGRIGEMDPGGTYIVYCDTGRRSAAATFLLRERNIDAFHLEGGLEAHAPSALPYVTE